jgi:pimeloyl-ACP methyl ester carboxylesterase
MVTPLMAQETQVGSLHAERIGLMPVPPPGVPAYRVHGAGPLAVYVAGIDGTGELLFKQIPALARSRRVATFRLRDRLPFTYDDLADDVAAIIRALGGERATILAESFGGTVALHFALRHPALAERLVIVNSFARFRARRRLRMAAGLAGLLPHRVAHGVKWIGNSVGLRGDGVARADRDRFFEIMRGVDSAAYAHRLRLIMELNLEDRLPEIRVPTLFIAGQRDLLLRSAANAHAMAARMPNATVRIIPRAGHSCLLGGRVDLAAVLDEHAAT